MDTLFTKRNALIAAGVALAVVLIAVLALLFFAPHAPLGKDGSLPLPNEKTLGAQSSATTSNEVDASEIFDEDSTAGTQAPANSVGGDASGSSASASTSNGGGSSSVGPNGSSSGSSAGSNGSADQEPSQGGGSGTDQGNTDTPATGEDAEWTGYY